MTRASCSRSARSSSGAWKSAAGSNGRARSARALEDVSDERDADRSYERLPRLGRLGDSARAVARELVEWREQRRAAPTARRAPCCPTRRSSSSPAARRETGRPRADPRPASTDCSTGAATWSWPRSREAASAPRREPPPEPAPRDPADAPLVSLAQALVRHRSMESGVAVELIATQSELATLVHSLRRGNDGDHVRVSHGWRRELVGDELSELVKGRRALSVGPDGRLVVREA